MSGAVVRRPRSLRLPSASWLGLAPFAVFILGAFLVPIGFVVNQAFRRTTITQPKGPDGLPLRNPVTQQFVKVEKTQYTWSNIHESLQGVYHAALMNSVQLSLVTAVLSTILGLILAHAVVSSGNRLLREVVATVSAVAANFGGIPLAFTFIAALDANSGVVTVFFRDTLHFPLDERLHFQLQELSGMTLVYLYFLVPLMVLVMMPALEGLRPQWGEAAENLGASRWQYWRYVAGPVLLPTVLGGLLLVFCASFSAFATAYALNHTFPLLPTEISHALSSNVSAGQGNLAAALAVDVIVFVLPLTVVYQLLQRRTSRWLA